jgi:hypothetical protein
MDKTRHLRSRRLRILAALTVLLGLIAAPVYAAGSIKQDCCP